MGPMTEAKEDGDTVKDAEVDHDDSDFKTVTSKKDRSEKIKEKPERRRKSRGARHRRDREKESAHREVKENSIEKEGEVEEEEEKEEKVTYVEAPIPKTNPWKKGKRTAAEEIEKKDVGKVREEDPPLEAAKHKKNILKEKKGNSVIESKKDRSEKIKEKPE